MGFSRKLLLDQNLVRSGRVLSRVVNLLQIALPITGQWVTDYESINPISGRGVVFHSDFGCLEGGVANTPCHLMYIFDPATNRVKSAATLLSTRREQAEMVGITKYKCTVHFGIAKTVFLNSFFRKTQRWEEKNCLC